MSIAYDGVISTSQSIGDACSRTTNDEIVVVCTGDNSLRRYDIVTRAQVGSTVSSLTGTPRGVAMVTSACAAVFFSLSSIDLVELSSNFKTNHTGSTALEGNIKGQVVASDIANGYCIAVTGTARRIIKFNGTTVTAIDLQIPPNDEGRCIIYKSANRFLIGTYGGRVYEINESGTILNTWTIEFPNTGSTNPTSSFPSPEISFLNLAGNLMTVCTRHGMFQVIDISTGTKIHERMVATNEGTTTGGVLMVSAESANGTCLITRSQTMPFQHLLCEMDVAIETGSLRGVVFTNISAANMVTCGIHPSNGKGWWINSQSTNNIYVTTQTTRGSTSKTPTSPDGLPFELLILQDVGAGQMKVVFNSYVASGGSYRVPSGATIIELHRKTPYSGSGGVNTKWSGSRYTT